MKKYFKVELLKAVLRKKQYFVALKLFFLIVLSQLGRNKRFIYEIMSTEINPSGQQLSGYRLESYSSLQEYELKAEKIIPEKCSVRFSPNECIGGGKQLWLGFMDHQVVFCGCTTLENDVDYFFPLKQNQVVISRCEVDRNCRGLGLYSLSLKMIVERMGQVGIQKCYIDCHDWNWPSQKGIEKAGFTLMGFGAKRKGILKFRALDDSN